MGFYRTEFASDNEYDQDRYLPLKTNFYVVLTFVFFWQKFLHFTTQEKIAIFMKKLKKLHYLWIKLCINYSIALTLTKASSASITKLKTNCATTSSSPCQKKTEKCIHWEQVMHCIPKRVHQWTNYSGLKRRKRHTAVGLFSLVPECK